MVKLLLQTWFTKTLKIIWKVSFKTLQSSPIIPLSLLSKVDVGLWDEGPGLFPVVGPEAGHGAVLRAGLESVPLGLVLEPRWGEDKGKDWPPALVLRVDVGLSEQGEAVLQVRVELGLPPWAEVSHWKAEQEKWQDANARWKTNQPGKRYWEEK